MYEETVDSVKEFDTHPEGTSPFVTVCLSVYNFEGTVIRALRSLIDQTYRNFEIVISDDCSSDRTVDVLVEFLRKYAGEVRIRLYRSRENGGVVRNRLRGMALGKGELFVQTDGDDFSMPDRLEKIVAAWNSFAEKPSIIATNALRWYEQEQRIGDRVIASEAEDYMPPADPVEGRIANFSAGFVISRELFEAFRDVPVPRGLIADDPVFARRALMLRGIRYCPEPIFYYGTSSSSASGADVSGKKWIRDRIRRLGLLARDIRHRNGTLTDKSRRTIIYRIRWMRYNDRLEVAPAWRLPLVWTEFLFVCPAVALWEMKIHLKRRAKRLLSALLCRRVRF